MIIIMKLTVIARILSSISIGSQSSSKLRFPFSSTGSATLQLTMCGGILNSMSEILKPTSNQQEFHASVLLPLPIIQYSLTIVTGQASINDFQRLESVDLEMHGFSPS
jgi:hypothetical protein